MFPFCLCPQTIDLPSLPTNLLVSWLVVSFAILRLSLARGLALSSQSPSLKLHCTFLPLPVFVFFIFCTVLYSQLGFPSSTCVPATLNSPYLTLTLFSPQPQNTFRDSVRAPNLSPFLLNQCLHPCGCFLKLETATLYLCPVPELAHQFYLQAVTTKGFMGMLAKQHY